ncbi:putative toxin-antitoxin system toxin component, PIN family [Hydrogenophaga sp.]|uniref:putative toxin-antitoxin system toxin component, PIN family n=1 Tax=Hydrogenophaga sp. TaxID=1904254 RepID=UPI00345C0820
MIDTNVVLDLFVFNDPACADLHEALQQARLRWLASDGMHEELRRVLDYPHIARRLGDGGAAPVLERFVHMSHRVDEAPKAPYTCRDADDQRFIDLAVAHQALLLSKDALVLALAKRLARVGVKACTPRDLVLENAA